MEWGHKGVCFEITTEPLGVLYLAAARAPKQGAFVRIRPFSALGRTEEEAIDLLKDQIRLEYRSVPEAESA